MRYKQAKIVSIASAIPERIVTNFDLEKIVDTSDEWIVQRTGIRERHIAPKDMKEPCIEFSKNAALSAIERSGYKPSDIDCVLCGTVSPDYIFPSTACLVAERIGCKGAFAFDFTSACSGFIYGLTLANALICNGQCKRVVVIGAEILSRSIDWSDRSTCILFADGAGAAVVTGSEDENKGILTCSVETDGSLGDILYCPLWTERNIITMKGNEVFKHAVRMMTDSFLKSLDAISFKIDDIDILIPHQANIRIINAIASSLKIPAEKVFINIEQFGNTSAASIPIALDQAWQQGKVKNGTVVGLVALGGGVTIGSTIMRF